jgi:hypothetical protein
MRIRRNCFGGAIFGWLIYGLSLFGWLKWLAIFGWLIYGLIRFGWLKWLAQSCSAKANCLLDSSQVAKTKANFKT